MEISRLINTLSVVNLNRVKLNLTQVFIKAIKPNLILKRPADIHEETNRQLGAVEEGSE
jgi:hypothetical protein